jgi:hypothetical protein
VWKRRERLDRLRTFSLPIEQLAAQISAAGDAAFTSPREFPALYASLVGEPSHEEPSSHEKPSLQAERYASEREMAVAQRVRASIDQMQIAISERWRRDVQGAAIWVAGLWGIGLSHAANRAGASEPRYVLSALLLGGVFAWIARDIAAAIEGLRRT